MNQRFFVEQISRLKLRFGEKAFDPETMRLIAREVMSLADKEFELIVDGLIATRRHTFPPLLVDFRDARQAIEKRMAESRDKGALRQFDAKSQGGLQAYLAKEFPGCKTLNEAIEVRRLQIRLAKAENPQYDPMEDPKWK